MSYQYVSRKSTALKRAAAQEIPAAHEPLSRGINGNLSGSRRIDLPGALQSKMENAFGADFSGLKLYESPEVGEAGDLAAAQGGSIAFAPDAPALTSRAGQELLGHELSHIVSQARGEVSGSGLLENASLEARADREGAMAADGIQLAAEAPAVSISGAGASAAPIQAKRRKGRGAKKKRSRARAAKPKAAPAPTAEAKSGDAPAASVIDAITGAKSGGSSESAAEAVAESAPAEAPAAAEAASGEPAAAEATPTEKVSKRGKIGKMIGSGIGLLGGLTSTAGGILGGLGLGTASTIVGGIGKGIGAIGDFIGGLFGGGGNAEAPEGEAAEDQSELAGALGGGGEAVEELLKKKKE